MNYELDEWSKWLFFTRFGGDTNRKNSLLAHYYYPIRDKVLRNARLSDHDTLLDVGCGEGIIGFGAIEKSETCHVVFCDISQYLLNHVADLAMQKGLLHRCSFIQASAENPIPLYESSIDVVAVRSVLIYIDRKQEVFYEFYRIMRPGGRLSIFEPINQFSYPEPNHIFKGYEVSPIRDVVRKLKDFYWELLTATYNSMIDFDERNLVKLCEAAGFNDIHLELVVRVRQPPKHIKWETFINISCFPGFPNLTQAMKEVLTPEERDKFVNHMKPLVEENRAIHRTAVSYLKATKY